MHLKPNLGVNYLMLLTSMCICGKKKVFRRTILFFPYIIKINRKNSLKK